MTIVYWLPLLLLLTLLLPLWWHRQRRRTPDSHLFAAAQFLPAITPQQKRIWCWQQWLLLLLRLLLISVLVFLLADIAVPFRQHTHIVSQARAQNIDNTDAYVYCREQRADCDIVTDDIWLWLARHEREWSAEKVLLLDAFADELPLPAQRPNYAHVVRIQTQTREVSTPAITAASTWNELNSNLPASRVWPSGTLRHYLILLFVACFIVERCLHHVSRR